MNRYHVVVDVDFRFSDSFRGSGLLSSWECVDMIYEALPRYVDCASEEEAERIIYSMIDEKTRLFDKQTGKPRRDLIVFPSRVGSPIPLPPEEGSSYTWRHLSAEHPSPWEFCQRGSLFHGQLGVLRRAGVAPGLIRKRPWGPAVEEWDFDRDLPDDSVENKDFVFTVSRDGKQGEGVFIITLDTMVDTLEPEELWCHDQEFYSINDAKQVATEMSILSDVPLRLFTGREVDQKIKSGLYDFMVTRPGKLKAGSMVGVCVRSGSIMATPNPTLKKISVDENLPFVLMEFDGEVNPVPAVIVSYFGGQPWMNGCERF